MMRGGNDKTLKWPLQGFITIQLLNQTGGDGHYVHVIDIDDSAGKIFNRVLSGERASRGWGFHEFISHTSLLQNYLKDDCIKLRIVEVNLNN